jgi:MinD-like ATPase involved in chromosome partitioning or flagellar assembly
MAKYMENNKVSEMCDKVIAVINNCGLANFISDERREALVSEIQILKSKQDRSLASKISEIHENYLKHYNETANTNPDFSKDFVNLQINCVSLLNEMEAALYILEKFKT